MSETAVIQPIAATSKPSAIASMAARIDLEPDKLLSTLKSTVFKKATNDELLALVVTSNEYQLNPFLKEIYAFPAKGGGITPIVGFDGWMKIINRQPNFDGMKVKLTEDGKAATCKLYLKDREHPVEVTEYLDECKRNTEPWSTMPKRMLRHKAIMQAGRVAFGIGGIHDEDEGNDIQMRNVTPPVETRKELREDPLTTQPEVSKEAKPSSPADTGKSSIVTRKVIVDDVKEKECSNKSTRYSVTLNIGANTVIAYTFSTRVGANAKELIDCAAVAEIDHDPVTKENKLVNILPEELQDGEEVV